MNHILVVQISDSDHDLLKQPLSKVLCIVALWLLGYLVKHLLTRNEVHDNMYFFGKLVEEVVGCFDYILMVQLARYFILLFMRHLLLFIWFSGYFHSIRH